jgi:hypothetical protein
VRNAERCYTWLRLLVNMYFPSGGPKSTTCTYQVCEFQQIRHVGLLNICSLASSTVPDVANTPT